MGVIDPLFLFMSAPFEKVVYTEHLEFRLKTRNIPHGLPLAILKKSNEHYYDIVTKHYIALCHIKFEDRYRDMAVTYDKKEGLVEIITIHPIKLYQKISRIKSGRWSKHE